MGREGEGEDGPAIGRGGSKVWNVEGGLGDTAETWVSGKRPLGTSMLIPATWRDRILSAIEARGTSSSSAGELRGSGKEDFAVRASWSLSSDSIYADLGAYSFASLWGSKVLLELIGCSL